MVKFFDLPITDILYTFVLGKTAKAKKLKLIEKNFAFCIELPIKAVKNMLIASSSSVEFKRIAGEKVNEFRDGLKILYSMIKLFLEMLKIEYYKNNILETLSFLLFQYCQSSFFRSGLLNSWIIIIDLLFLIEIYRTKNFKFLNNIFLSFSFPMVFLYNKLNFF